MLKKIGGLARALAIVLAIVGGFVALTMMNLPLVLVVLGLVAGLAMPEDRLVLSTVTLIALPAIGAALGTIPAVSWRSPARSRPTRRRESRGHTGSAGRSQRRDESVHACRAASGPRRGS